MMSVALLACLFSDSCKREREREKGTDGRGTADHVARERRGHQALSILNEMPVGKCSVLSLEHVCDVFNAIFERLAVWVLDVAG